MAVLNTSVRVPGDAVLNVSVTVRAPGDAVLNASVRVPGDAVRYLLGAIVGDIAVSNASLELSLTLADSTTVLYASLLVPGDRALLYTPLLLDTSETDDLPVKYGDVDLVVAGAPGAVAKSDTGDAFAER